MRNDSIPWLVAGVSIVLLLIAAWLWLGTKKDLETVLADNRADITTQRQEIAEKCTGPNADQEECDAALEEMADILREFSDELDIAATTSMETQ